MGRIVQQPPAAARSAESLVVGGWWHEADQPGRIVCDVCPRRCVLKPDARGFCFVRQNVAGQMVLTTYGRSTGFCVDPIEKKPLNHFYPGTAVLSFGTAGCNLGCKFCQNWDISKSREIERLSEVADPETVADAAGQLGCRSVAFTYNDPIIWAEYAIDTAEACRRRAIKTVAVTSGYIEPPARAAFFSAMDAANVDLKAMSEQFYSDLAYGHLQPVLDCLEWLKRETDVWFEITNLIIPRANDTGAELARLCDWILQHVGDEVPVHFTAFHPAFRLTDRPATPAETLQSAYATAREAGLKYVYLGNVHDPGHDSTYCPNCAALLIQRDWHQLRVYRMTGDRCSHCGTRIAGHFEAEPGTWGARRQPVRIADFVSTERRDPSDQPAVTPVADAVATTIQQRPRPQLSKTQRDASFAAAAEQVVAAVNGRPVRLSDPSLGGAAEDEVMGAFVTLKRGRHLRACRGVLGRPMTLVQAVQQAAQQTAVADHRFPPLSPTELPHLHLDVSVLHSFCDLPEDPDQRVDGITLGRHGLTIQRGDAGGLLLPNVPVENGWNVQMFLRQLCRKAGLPTTAWQDPLTNLRSFEAIVIDGPMDSIVSTADCVTSAIIDRAAFEKLRNHCLVNLRALLVGATPNYYLADCPDATVQGVALELSVPSAPTPLRYLRLSMRPGLPLQATVFQLCEAAARGLAQLDVPHEQLTPDSVSLVVLSDGAMHGTVQDAELPGIHTGDRVLVVAEQQRSAWLRDANATGEQLVADAARSAGVLNAANAGVFSFAVQSNRAEFRLVNVPRAERGPETRAPAVAGAFYPADPATLGRQVDRFCPEDDDPTSAPYAAVLVPHAGLRFSGQLAATTWQSVDIPQHVVILAPKHTRHGVPWAVAPYAHWALPGAVLDGGVDLAQALARRIDALELDAAAHREEHAIEVQLPILAKLAPQTKVVGIVVGGGDFQACQQFAAGLAEVVGQWDEPVLLVVSSDLNHYASEAENRRLDRVALQALESMDPQRLYADVHAHGVSMCGVLPAVITLSALQQMDRLHEARQIGYTTSAAATGNAERVVGYAGMLFR